MIIDDIESHVDNRSRERFAVDPNVAIIKVQAAGAENLGSEVKLGMPVADNVAAEEVLCPGIHLLGDLLGNFKKERVTGNGELEADLVV